MSTEIEFRKKLSEKEILKLKEPEIKKLERVNESLTNLENAEGYKESQQKMRILFERAAADMLPFIIYCLTFAPIAVYSLYKILELKDTPQFYWGLGGLLIIMILPLLILPNLPFKKWFKKN